MAKTEVIIVRYDDNEPAPTPSIIPYLIVAFVILLGAGIYFFMVGQPKDNYTSQNATPTLCESLSNPNNADACWYDVALASSNASYCGRIIQDSSIDMHAKGKCYAEVAKQNSDSSTCEVITTAYWADKCWYDVAIAKGDASLCERIVAHNNYDPWTKDKCVQQIAGG